MVVKAQIKIHFTAAAYSIFCFVLADSVLTALLWQFRDSSNGGPFQWEHP